MHMRHILKFQGCYLPPTQTKEIIFQKLDFITAEQLFSQHKHQTLKNKQTRIISKRNSSKTPINGAIIIIPTQKRITRVFKLKEFSRLWNEMVVMKVTIANKDLKRDRNRDSKSEVSRNSKHNRHCYWRVRLIVKHLFMILRSFINNQDNNYNPKTTRKNLEKQKKMIKIAIQTRNKILISKGIRISNPSCISNRSVVKITTLLSRS